MSFLTRAHPLARQTALLTQAPRLFSTSIAVQKGPVEAGKETLKKVDRTVSDTIVAGIDKGIEAKDKAAATAGIEVKKADGTAKQAAGEAKGKAAELAGEAKGKAAELKGKIQS